MCDDLELVLAGEYGLRDAGPAHVQAQRRECASFAAEIAAHSKFRVERLAFCKLDGEGPFRTVRLVVPDERPYRAAQREGQWLVGCEKRFEVSRKCSGRGRDACDEEQP